MRQFLRTVSLSVTLGVIGGAIQPTPCFGHARGNHAGDWSPGQNVRVCVCPVPGGADLSVAIQGAIDIWNASKAGFAGGVTFEWTQSLVACPPVATTDCDVVLDFSPGNVWGSVQPTPPPPPLAPPVEVDVEPADGLTARGVQRVLMHELGHVKGLGHSALSNIMRWNFRGAGTSSPTAGDLNGADAFETPNADDIALNKELHGLVVPDAGAEGGGNVVPEGEDLWRYQYFMDSLGPNQPVTRFSVDLPEGVGITAVNPTQMPPNWNFAVFEAVPPIVGGSTAGVVKPLETQEGGQGGVMTFWTDDPTFGIPPGGFAVFEVMSNLPPMPSRAFTNSPSFDTDEFPVEAPGVPPVGNLVPAASDWGLATLSLLVLSAGAVLLRQRRVSNPIH